MDTHLKWPHLNIISIILYNELHTIVKDYIKLTNFIINNKYSRLNIGLYETVQKSGLKTTVVLEVIFYLYTIRRATSDNISM
jgi:hypothetical protein